MRFNKGAGRLGVGVWWAAEADFREHWRRREGVVEGVVGNGRCWIWCNGS